MKTLEVSECVLRSFVAALLPLPFSKSSSVGLSLVICTSAFLLPRGLGEGGAMECEANRDVEGGGAFGVVLPLIDCCFVGDVANGCKD